MTKPTEKTQGEKQHPGTREVGKIVKTAWSEDKLMEALHILDSTPGVSIRGVAKQYNLSEATLRFRRNKIQAGETDLKKAGRKCAFDGETRGTFGKMYCRPLQLWVQPSMLEIQVSLVLKILTTLLSTLLVLYKLFYCNNQFSAYHTLYRRVACGFRRSNRPGYKWMKNFLKGNRRTTKKAEMISAARMANTSNPFIICDFYDTLERPSTLSSLSEAYLEPCRTSKMGPFAKMINGFQSLNIFAKKLQLRRWTRL